MKTWFLTLMLLGAAGLVQADGMPGATAPAEVESSAAQARPQARRKAHGHRHRHLPSGDLRHCLELGSNEEIIRCAESPRKR